jgi:ABC-2 type transport system ATP-binding protein
MAGLSLSVAATRRDRSGDVAESPGTPGGTLAIPGSSAGTPGGPTRLIVRALEKTYGNRKALAGVSFELGDGMCGLLGPNGAGKSTLMRCLAGVCQWDQGEVTVDGLDAERHPGRVRRKVGFMPERLSFPPEMRTEAYLSYVAACKGIPRRARPVAVELALERAGLGAARGRVLGNLSKGYRQRVGLAQALLDDPPVVVLDEPAAGVDPLNLLEIRTVLSEYAASHVVLLSTHTLSEARLACDRLVVLGAGSVVYDGPARELGGAAPGGTAQLQIRARGGDEDALRGVVAGAGGRVLRADSHHGAVEAVVEIPDGVAPGAAGVIRALVLNDWSVDAAERLTDALEDAFRRAVAQAGSSPP